MPPCGLCKIVREEIFNRAKFNNINILMNISSTACIKSLLAVALLLLAGCQHAPKPNYHEDAAKHLPNDFEFAANPERAVVINQDWWQLFYDANLERLVAASEGQNLDVAIAKARTQTAQAGVEAVRNLPRLSLQANRFEETTGYPDAIKGRGLFDRSGTRLNADLSWEIDIFGASRAKTLSGLSQLGASEWGVYGARLEASQAVAKDYVAWQSYAQKLAVLGELERSQNVTVFATQKRLAVGLGTSLDENEALVALTELQSNRQKLKAALEPLRQNIALNTQISREALFLETNPALWQAPMVTAPIASGQPVNMLMRRPDLRAYELLLQSKAYDVAEAKANRWPKLFLSAVFGRQDLALSPFPAPLDKTNFKNVAGVLAWPLFDSRIKAGIKAADSELNVAMLEYQKQAQVALTQVESLLNERAQRTQDLALINIQLAKRKDSFSRAQKLFAAGLANRLQLEAARRGYLAVELERIDTAHALLDNSINLYTALGGAWQREPQAVDTKHAAEDATKSATQRTAEQVGEQPKQPLKAQGQQ